MCAGTGSRSSFRPLTGYRRFLTSMCLLLCWTYLACFAEVAHSVFCVQILEDLFPDHRSSVKVLHAQLLAHNFLKTAGQVRVIVLIYTCLFRLLSGALMDADAHCRQESIQCIIFEDLCSVLQENFQSLRSLTAGSVELFLSSMCEGLHPRFFWCCFILTADPSMQWKWKTKFIPIYRLHGKGPGPGSSKSHRLYRLFFVFIGNM